MVPSDRDSSPKCICGPIFTSYLIGESPFVLALGFKVGLGISQQTRILNGIHFTRHFREKEKKRERERERERERARARERERER